MLGYHFFVCRYYGFALSQRCRYYLKRLIGIVDQLYDRIERIIAEDIVFVISEVV